MMIANANDVSLAVFAEGRFLCTRVCPRAACNVQKRDVDDPRRGRWLNWSFGDLHVLEHAEHGR